MGIEKTIKSEMDVITSEHTNEVKAKSFLKLDEYLPFRTKLRRWLNEEHEVKNK